MSVFSVNDVRYEKLFSLARKTQKEKVLTFFLSTENTENTLDTKQKKKQRKKNGWSFYFRALNAN